MERFTMERFLYIHLGLALPTRSNQGWGLHGQVKETAQQRLGID